MNDGIKTIDPAEGTLTGKAFLRLMGNLEIDPVGKCWLWTGGVASTGYPRTTINGRKRIVNRVLFKLLNPAIDIEDLSVRPACNNPICVNPDHQRLRGQGRSGQHVPSRKLTLDEVKTIKRLLLEGGKTQRAIAARFGVSYRTISQIHTGVTWAAVQP
jgi:hypothetical protein